MPRFRWDQFGAAFSARLSEIGYSLAVAETKWPSTNKAMLSRATRGHKLSVENLLELCRLAGLDPYAFVDGGKRRRVTMKSIVKQAVTDGVSRETGENP